MSTIYRCRLCLKSSRNKIDVFKDDFPKMIEILTGLKVDPLDDFPKTSCLDCARNVKIALKTRKQIMQSHKTLLEEFLAKCREPEIIPDIMESDPSKLNETTATNIITESKVMRPVRKLITRSCVSKLQKTKINSVTDDASTALRKEKYDDRLGVELKNSVVMNYLDDSNSCHLASPLGDPTSDVDWVPDKPQDSIKQEPESTKPLPVKASDGVFFVKKRQNARKPRSPETVVRIKKKPKCRKAPQRVTCEVCKREVQNYWLQKHMETHEYNPVKCQFCGLISKSATALRHHVFYYHRRAADEYMCDQCGRSFRSKYRLNLHKKKEHGGTKDFECTTCGKRFFERMHLKRHIDKTHKNIRPYVCDFCGKSFKSKNHIKIHERIHSKEAPYNCHMCGESFKMKLTLRTHLKGVHNVHEEQKVFCDVCKRGFASDIALKAHVNSRIHETQKCQYCSEMFTSEYMVNHLRDVHGMGENV